MFSRYINHTSRIDPSSPPFSDGIRIHRFQSAIEGDPKTPFFPQQNTSLVGG